MTLLDLDKTTAIPADNGEVALGVINCNEQGTIRLDATEADKIFA